MGLLRLLTRERRGQVDQSSAGLLRICVLGPLRVQEKAFGGIRKFIAAGQDRPLMGNSQINTFQMLIRDLRGLEFGFGGLLPTVSGCFQN